MPYIAAFALVCKMMTAYNQFHVEYCLAVIEEDALVSYSFPSARAVLVPD